MSVGYDSPVSYSEEWWRVTLSSIGDAVMVTDAGGNVVFMNSVAESLTGWRIDEAQSKPLEEIFSIIDENSRQTIKNPVTEVLNTKSVVKLGNHTLLLTRTGEEVHIDDSAAPIRDEQGNIFGVVLVFRDVSERKRAEAARLRLSAIVNTSDDAIISKTLESKITSWNKAAERIFGYRAEEAIGQSIYLIIPPELHHEEAMIIDQLRRGERIDHYETVRLRKDGTLLNVSLTISLLKDSEGNIIGVSKIARDITEQKRAEEELRRSQRELKDFVENATIGLHWVGPDGTILWANRAEMEMLGYSPEEYLGHNIADFHADRPVIEDILTRLTNDEKLQDYEARLVCKDGSIKYGLINSSVYRENGHFIHTRCFTRDITEQKLAMEREQLARQEAEAANRLKDEFLSTLSHELRTPLNAMLGWATLLRRINDPERLQQGLETIERNVRIQAQIVEDLLDLSRIMTGKVRLDVQRVSLPSVIDAAIEAMQPAAENKGIRLQKVVDSFASPVSGDPNRLQQVFYNLLSNAIKFTPQGGRVQIVLERVNSHLEVSVIDSGIGIKPEFLPYVFDRFRQADSTSKREYGGLGIGLAIVKQLIEMHGGSVRAKSPGEGQGATFIVTLPLTAIHAGDEGGRVHTKASSGVVEAIPSTLEGVTVLVVDDEPDSRELIKVVLENAKAKVILVASAKEGMNLLTAQKVDVLISDIGMPHEDGFEFIRRVRALRENEGGRIPAIALTAFARSEDRTRALLSGFQIHVAKPVEPAELVATVVSLAKSFK